MLKYTDTKIVFQEIPDEITLAINISGCPIRCPDCHSKYLWEDVGEPLNRCSLHNLIEKNKGISCIAFMGGDANVPYLHTLIYWTRTRYPKLKIAWYSGRDSLLWQFKESEVANLDYIKIGSYIKERGPLNSRTTNQRLYKISHSPNGGSIVEDITKRFWKETD